VRIIVIGGAGTIGKAIVATLVGRHDVVVAGRRSGTVPVDIQSPESVRDMFRQVGAFDALVCAAGEAHFGPFDTMSEDELALGIESKLLGQVRLVLLGRSLIADGGSFTVSPGLAADSYEQFGRFNPGRLPVPMGTIASAFLRSIEGWRTGEIIRAR
jgi:NAD(P)-dependent dehydrogenase (short-subunit alcohol dehydrogenase family)